MLLAPVVPRPLSNALPTALIWDMEMEGHEGDASHPERPDRLRAIMARLLSSGLAGAALNTNDYKHVPSPKTLYELTFFLMSGHAFFNCTKITN